MSEFLNVFKILRRYVWLGFVGEDPVLLGVCRLRRPFPYLASRGLRLPLLRHLIPSRYRFDIPWPADIGTTPFSSASKGLCRGQRHYFVWDRASESQRFRTLKSRWKRVATLTIGLTKIEFLICSVRWSKIELPVNWARPKRGRCHCQVGVFKTWGKLDGPTRDLAWCSFTWFRQLSRQAIVPDNREGR